MIMNIEYFKKISALGVFLCILFLPIHLSGDVHPQGGVETYMGANNLFLFTPWVGMRIGLSSSSSLLFKYYSHNIRFDFIDDEGEETRRKARLSNFTAVFYTQKWNHDFYSACSYFVGTDSYQAVALDAGTELRLSDRISAVAGIYYLNEKSVLWYPDEETRRISIYSLKGGVKVKIIKGLYLFPKFNFYVNSEDVRARSYHIGIQVNPLQAVYLSLSYYHYSESARYKFSGNYFHVGLNFYY